MLSRLKKWGKIFLRDSPVAVKQGLLYIKKHEDFLTQWNNFLIIVPFKSRFSLNDTFWSIKAGRIMGLLVPVRNYREGS